MEKLRRVRSALRGVTDPAAMDSVTEADVALWE